MKSESILDEVRGRLIDIYIHSQIFAGTPAGVVTDRTLITDGRKRKRGWRWLIENGYLDTAGVAAGHATITSKVFDEIPVEGVTLDLASKFRYDRYANRKGERVWVIWDSLSVAEKKLAILAMRADPASIRFGTADKYTGEATWTGLRGFDPSKHRWDFFVVRDDSVVEKAVAAAKAEYRNECRKSGLNWHVRHAGLADLPDGREIPVQSGEGPLLGGPGGLPAEPEQWRDGLPASIQAARKGVAEAQGHLARLLQMEAVVEKAGGWDAFLAGYDKAIDAYVEANFKFGESV